MPKVYVGNLASSVTSSDLLTHFSSEEEILGASATTDKVASQCRGCGFVDGSNSRHCNPRRPMRRISPAAEIMQWQ